MSEPWYKQKYIRVFFLSFTLLIFSKIYSTNYYSSGTGLWNTPGTWYTDGCGGVVVALSAPGAGDDVTICATHIVTMDGNVGACHSLTIKGTATWVAALTTNVGAGGININSGGDITGAFNGILTTTGGFIINATLTSASVTITTKTTGGQTISGTGSLAKLDISANTTNNGTLTVTTTLASTTASTLTQGASSTLTYGGTTAVGPTLDASSNVNTVNYNGGANQTVKSTTYHNLTISNGGTSTLAGVITVNNNLSITGGTLASSTFQITGNVTGIFSISGGAFITLGGTAGSPVLFPTNYTSISLATTSTVTYSGNYAQTVSSTPLYGNLTVNTFAGSKTANGDLTVGGNLITTSPVILDMTTYSLNLTGNYTSTGAMSFSSGNMNIGGTFSNSGTFTSGTGTVSYDGSLATQTVRATDYNNLTFSGTASKALQNVVTVLNISGTFTRGTMTVNAPGANSEVRFNGTSQTMTGNAMSFRNLTISNSSVTISSDITVNGVLTFTTGNIITGANNVILPAAGSVSRSSGHVEGNLRKNVASGVSVSRTFEVGTGVDYTPFDITFTSVTTQGNLTVSTTSGDHPQLASSGFTASKTVNRYWTINNTGIVFTNAGGSYDVSCAFVNGDKDGGLTTSSCIIKTYNAGVWASPIVGTQGANSTQATTLTIPTTPNTIDLQIGENISSPTKRLYSIANSTWSTAGTWSSTSGGASCGCIPTNADTVFIENGFTVTMDGNSGVAKGLSINTGGIADWSGALTTNIGTAGINIAATGDITGAGAGTLTNQGNLTLNKVLSNTAFTLKMANGSGQTISGTGTLAILDISSDVTNNGNIEVTTTLASTTASTLTQGASSTLTYGGATLVPTLDATSNANMVDYNRAGTQTVKSGTYHNLTISNSGTSTLAGVITVNNNLSITGGTLATSTFQITGNAIGTLDVAGGAGLTIGLTTSATLPVFPTNYTTGNITLSSSSTVMYQSNIDKTISSTPSSYGNVTLSTGASTSSMTFSGAIIPIAGNLTINTSVTLTMNTDNLVVTGNLAGAGTLIFTTGDLNIGGNNTTTGTFTSGTGTVSYDGSLATQTVRATDYNNLTFSGTASKALQNVVTVLNISGTFTRGTMTVNAPGANSEVRFNGTSQTMTGNAMSFRNLTISNSSVTISSDITVNGVLTFTTGNIITGANNVILPAAGSVSRSSGHVEGNLRKNVASGVSVSRTFEVGTGVDYTPFDITFTSVTTQGNLTVSTTSGDHPQLASSGFTASKTVNRYWTINNTGIVFTNAGGSYDVSCAFVNGDKDGGLTTSSCIIKTYNAGVWASPIVGTQGANSTQATTLTIPTTPNTIDLQIGENISSPTKRLYSIANSTWSTAGTWSSTSGGASCGCIPTNADTVFIENGFTVTMDGNSGVAKGLSINTGGIADWSGALTTNIGTAGINIAATGDITGAGAGTLTNQGNLTLNKVLSNTAFTLKMANGSGQTISGTGTLAILDISSDVTNNGNIEVTTTLASTTASTLTQGASSTLTYGGATLVPTLDATSNANMVDYNRAGTQTVKSGTYHNLTISNSGTSTLAGVITVNNNLSINGGTLATSTFQITGNAIGTLDVSAGASLTLAGSLVATTNFPTLFTNITLNTTSTVNYSSAGAQTIKALDYGTLTISGARTTASVTLESGTIGINNNTTTCFNPTATFTTGAYVTTGNTIEFKGTGAQTIRTFTNGGYNNLTSSGVGTRTLLNGGTIAIAGILTPGTNTYTVTNSTVNFNGSGNQNIPALAASNYNILKISNAGIKTLTANVSVVSDLNVSAATFDLSSFTANRTTVGGTLTVVSGATLRVGGTLGGVAGSNFPNNYTTNTLQGTVEFSSVGNTIPTFNYTNVIISGITTAPAGNLNVAGDFINNGTFTHNGGSITFNGTTAQTIGGSSVTSFKNITLNNSAGVGLSSAQNLEGILTLSAGTFATNNMGFTVISKASGTGSIATIAGGADITGNITMQRYISSGKTGWVLLGAPIIGATLQQWDDDFITGGFPGSQSPSIANPSILSYDETLPGIYDDGYVTPTNITDPITAKKGYWAYIVTTTPVNIDVTGTTIKGTQTFPITYTDDISQPASEDGWNLIANPYPSTIDWDEASWTKTNVNDAVYTYNPTLDQYTSYVGGIGINGGSNLIASSQGFLVQTNAPGPVLQITESAKVNNDAPFIRTSQTITDDILKLNLTGNNYSDEVVVRFNSTASKNFDDGLDAMKFFSFNSIVPGMATVSINKEYSINALPLLTSNISIPLKVQVGVSGTYKIHLDPLTNLSSNACLTLEDLLTKTITNLHTNSSYSFYIKDTTIAPRFIIHICSPSISTTITEQHESLNDLIKVVSNDNTIDLLFDFNESTNTIINVYNSIGQQVVMKNNIAAYKNRISLDFSDKAKGIYYVKIQADDQIITKKIVKSL